MNYLNLNYRSMTSFSTNLLAMAVLGFSTFNSNQLSKFKPEELNFYPNYLLLYYRSFVTPALGTLIILLLALNRKDFRSYLKMWFKNNGAV